MKNFKLIVDEKNELYKKFIEIEKVCEKKCVYIY